MNQSKNKRSKIKLNCRFAFEKLIYYSFSNTKREFIRSELLSELNRARE